MRSALAAVVVLLIVGVLFLAPSGRAGERVPSSPVPVKVALEKMKKNRSTPKGAIALVRFYAEVFDGKTVELFQNDVSSAGLTNEHVVDALVKSQCAPVSEAQLKAGAALVTEYGEALAPELRAFVLGQQGKAAEAAPLFLQALETMQPLDRCYSVHPDDVGAQGNRLSAWMTCTRKLAPATSPKKLEALEKQSMKCMAESFGVVG